MCKVEIKLDMMGEFCPRPIIELTQAMRALPPGGRIAMCADDPGVEKDVMAWCKATGHRLLQLEKKEKTCVFRIEKKG